MTIVEDIGATAVNLGLYTAVNLGCTQRPTWGCQIFVISNFFLHTRAKVMAAKFGYFQSWHHRIDKCATIRLVKRYVQPSDQLKDIMMLFCQHELWTAPAAGAGTRYGRVNILLSWKMRGVAGLLLLLFLLPALLPVTRYIHEHNCDIQCCTTACMSGSHHQIEALY